MKRLALSLCSPSACSHRRFSPRNHLERRDRSPRSSAIRNLEIQSIFDGERFPNIVVTNTGTVLATWGNKQVRARRSEDGGKTWGPEIVIAKPGFQGGGTTVDETSGDILAFVEEVHPPAPLTVYRSQDDGLTWTRRSRRSSPTATATCHRCT